MKDLRTRNILIFALLILCVVELRALIRDAQEAREHQIARISYEDHSGQGFQKLEIGDIDTWMTFEYINTVFKLPTDYLKNTLGITDRQYPKIHIGKYARQEDASADIILENVRAAVSAYPAVAATSI